VPLDDLGRAQARRAAPLLAQLTPTLIVASDLGRAQETAAALASVVSMPVRTDAALRETYAGQWQGLHRHEIEEQFGASWAAWSDGDDSVRPGGDGELRVEVAQRVVAALEGYVRELPADSTLVAVTHGGAARAAIGALMGLEPHQWGALGVLANCAWSVLHERTTGAAWRLVEYNAGSLPEPALADDR